MHPIQTGNWVLIGLGIVMTLGGPWLLYRTVRYELLVKTVTPGNATSQKVNAAINLLIGAALLFAGVLFIINNLRGNPLA